MAEKPAPAKRLTEKNTKQEMLEKVQDIAEKTVEGTSQSRSLAELQKLLLEQSRKGPGEKP